MLRPQDRGQRALALAGGGGATLCRLGGVVLLMGPIVLVIWLSFGGDEYTTVPPSSYALRWYENIFLQPEFVPAFWISLKIAAIVTPTSLVLGTLAAFALRRHRVPGAAALEAVFYSPIMVPLVVTGIALLFFFNMVGFTANFWNVTLGHIIITFPYVIRTVSVALARYDPALDEAAASLGARPWQVFLRVTLPVIRPGLFAGALFAFTMSFDDFTVTIFLIGTDTHTLPVAIYQYMEWNVDSTVAAVSALLVAMSVAMMLLVERLIGLDRFIGVRG